MKTILVVDDKREIRTMVAASLRQHGYSTLHAADGAEGVTQAVTHKPDLILCDVDMPVMDGYQTMAAIHANPITTSIPVILMSGSEARLGFRLGMARGADDVLIKPFSADELIEAIVSRFMRHTDMEFETYQRAEKIRHDAVEEYTKQLADPINGILGAVTSIMVEYAAMKPEEASVSVRQLNESATKLNQVTRHWAH